MRYPDCLTSPVAESTCFGFGISQTWQDLALWEAFLNVHRPASILELGTWRGGMAHFLSLQMKFRGGVFHTVDCTDGFLDCRAQIEDAGGVFHQIDIFSDDGRERIREMIGSLPKPLLLFCDDGNKPLEWATFVPHLSSGDYAAVHDWLTEFHPENCVPELAPIWHDECASVSSMTRFFHVENS